MGEHLPQSVKPVEEGEYPVSLMDSFASDCVALTWAIVKDGYGGYTSAWTDGITFPASFEYSASPEMIIAEKQGVSRTYKMYVDKRLILEYHDAFRRVSDGQTFRVTNSGEGRYTPAPSTLDKRLIEVEKCVLPDAQSSSGS